MSSQVFYRKWRPQVLSEVVGQDHVTQTLRNAVYEGRVAHAYLFCGPRGTGKTSTGRILSKAINCLNPLKGEPCNNCDMCRAINEGSALDVIEIDAASNRGIDEIRDLKEKVNYAPNVARYKVYIIDEVHMITKEASNAFLKTLEEPPAHAIFILATTEPHKVLPTILSRCQRFDFHRLSQNAVISKLELICSKEDIHIEPEALRIVSKVTTGSLRDAENLLQQLFAYYGHHVEIHQVQAMLGMSGDLRVRDMAKHIVNEDISAGIRTINSVSDDGIDLRQFNRELVSYLRDLLLLKSGSEEVIDVTSEDMVELKSLVNSVDLNYLLTAVKLFGEADFRLDNYSPLPIELALVGCILSVREGGQKSHAGSSDEIPKSLEVGWQVYATPIEVVKSQDGGQPDHSVGDGARGPASMADSSEEQTKPDQRIETVPSPDTVETPVDIYYVRSRWKEFINTMRGEGSTGNLDARLRSACEPVEVEDSNLTLGFYHEYHKGYIEDPKYKHLVEKKLLEFFKQPYKVNCIIIERKKEMKSKPVTDTPVVKAAIERGAKIIDGES